MGKAASDYAFRGGDDRSAGEAGSDGRGQAVPAPVQDYGNFKGCRFTR